MYFRFHSGPYGNSKGFHIEYKAMPNWLYTACGGNYSNASGAISSPSYPDDYPEQADCIYLISLQNGMVVNIDFHTMDIDCQGSPSDYIEMRDGNSENSPLMARLCGNGSNIPDIIQTTQNHLRIR